MHREQLAMTSKTPDPRPPLSCSELCAFERLVATDNKAAMALCFPNTARIDDLARAHGALARARASDAALNGGAGNRESWAYAAWLARQKVECGQQVTA
jgi:hypothetical protein